MFVSSRLSVSSLRRGAAIVASAATLAQGACAEGTQNPALNQRAAQDLNNWIIRKEGADYFVVCAGEERERYRAPDGNNMVERVPHPPFIRQQPWSLLRASWHDQIHRDNDIWVATFPKCGTTFMEQIVLLLQTGGDADVLDNTCQNDYNSTTRVGKVWPEGRVRVEPDPADTRPKMSMADFASVPSPRLLKTHAPRQLFLDTRPVDTPSISASGRPHPLASGTRVVYVSRSPDDACVSAYYHAANPQKQGFPFDAWAKLWLDGLFEHGRWSDHVAGWRAEALQNPQQVLWVKYEDLKADPSNEIRRIAKFIGVDASDDLVDRVVVASGFEHMRARAGSMQRFYRKGKVGDSANHFSPHLRAQFNAAVSEQMRGVDNPYARRGMSSKEL